MRPKSSMILSLVASLDTILSIVRITKALTRLRGCSGWSAPLVFANAEDRLPRFEAQNINVFFLENSDAL